MNKKHREAFRELRALLRRHEMTINGEGLYFEIGEDYYDVGASETFNHNYELVFDSQERHHSISSEAEDE